MLTGRRIGHADAAELFGQRRQLVIYQHRIDRRMRNDQRHAFNHQPAKLLAAQLRIARGDNHGVGHRPQQQLFPGEGKARAGKQASQIGSIGRIANRDQFVIGRGVDPAGQRQSVFVDTQQCKFHNYKRRI